MKFVRFAVLLAGVAMLSSTAFATSITFTGSAAITASGFSTSTTGAGAVHTGTVTAGFGSGSTVNYTVPLLGGLQYAFHDYTGANTPTVLNPIEVMTFLYGGKTIDLFITSVAPGAVATSTGVFGTLTATGYFTESGLAGKIPTTVVFTSTAKATGIQPFSAVATYTGNFAITPEPSSLMLMGTSLLAMGGFATRRKLFV